MGLRSKPTKLDRLVERKLISLLVVLYLVLLRGALRRQRAKPSLSG